MRMCANVVRTRGEDPANVCEYFANAREFTRTTAHPRRDRELSHSLFLASRGERDAPRRETNFARSVQLMRALARSDNRYVLCGQLSIAIYNGHVGCGGQRRDPMHASVTDGADDGRTRAPADRRTAEISSGFFICIFSSVLYLYP